MTQSNQKPMQTIFAPAKINLYLHVTGKLNNGYHTLDSLVSFSDIGDSISIEDANEFAFEIDGPFAPYLSLNDQNNNLVVRAALTLAQTAKRTPNIKITLTKNLPIAAGLGGGSADAAATIWGLQDWWNLPRDARYLPALLKTLGADLPACMTCQPVRVLGIGETLEPAPLTQEIPIILVNPLKPCLTAETFLRFDGTFRKEISIPKTFDDYWALIDFLKSQDNDLLAAAKFQVPEIENVLTALNLQKGCNLARMSGSGATCFGLFESEEQTEKAIEAILSENPDWWIKSGWLNRPERY